MGQIRVEDTQIRSETMDKYPRSRSRSESQHKQTFATPERYDRSRDHRTGRLASNPDPSISNGSIGSKSTDRGRTMQRRYEFIDSDDKPYKVLSPVQEATKSNDSNDDYPDNTGRESNMTTMTNLIQRCVEPSSTQLSTCQSHGQQETNEAIGNTSVTQPSPSQSKLKRRPPPLNLNDPVHVGMVKRSNHYEIEHIAIKSSKAEHFGFSSPYTDLSKYDDRLKNPPRISPLEIPNLDGLRGVDPLELYSEWRKNLKPVRTASRGSIHITVPTREEDTFMTGKEAGEDRLPITDYPIAQDTPIVNRVRSRSTLGIREDLDNERHRQFSGNSLYTASEYSIGMPSGRGSGIIRSATMNDATHGGRQFSGGSGSRASYNDAMMNAMPPRIGTETISPPFTPLTPFIMRASGAPAGVERGAKTLFGEHGWLEDTAASGTAKPKMEKMGGFLEGLKRKAREIVRHI
jgi:hypothetical protein